MVYGLLRDKERIDLGLSTEYNIEDEDAFAERLARSLLESRNESK
jgi:hypothetical protein